MGYPHGPQQGYDPYSGQRPAGYARPGYGADQYAGSPQPGLDAAPYGGQPGYVVQPYGTPEYGYGPQAYAHNGYRAQATGAAPHQYIPGYGQPRAGGGTAITAAVIALLASLAVGLTTAIQPWRLMVLMDHAGIRFYSVTVPYIVGGGVAVLWFGGSILLFGRKPVGRVLVIIMSSLLFVVFGVSAAVSMSNTGDPIPEIFVALPGCGLPLLILALAAAPPTGRWIRAGRPGGYPPDGY
ncbi:hypothetical protein ACTWPB_00695 [Nocardia sp. IBHARD005]|uniref:hypothetical protein n=1 Tax=Nocardia sp. IBHARD005 TaxID=3457765 RepID=UPI004057E695